MNGASANRLYDLLPRIIRMRDLEERGSLRALLQVLERQRIAVEADIERLYDDLFIETCADWVVPYIGALIDAAPGATRAEVAHTLRRRRRPGLQSTLVELARDVSGCAVEAEEVFPDGGKPRLELTVYVTDAIPMRGAEARQLRPGCFTFHPMGVETPLYRDPWAEPEGHTFVPSPLRRNDRPADVTRHVKLYAGGEEIDASRIDLADLAGWDRPAERGRVCLDPERGRISFAAGDEPESVRLHYAYGARSDVGGGPYPRGPVPVSGGDADWTVPGDPPESLAHALDRRDDAAPASTTITIADNCIHHLRHHHVGERHRTIELRASQSLAIRADEGRRPCLIGDLVVEGPRGQPAFFALDGCLLEGTIRVHGDVQIELRHCTVRAPDAAAREGEAAIHLSAEDDAPSLRITTSVVGPLRLAAHRGRTEIEDSIIESPALPAISATVNRDVPHEHEVMIRRSTILGPVRAPHAKATESSLEAGVDGESRFGDPRFPGPRHLAVGAAHVAAGAHASNPVLVGRLARLLPRLEEHLPLDTEVKMILV
jgi:hypothetical protein